MMRRVELVGTRVVQNVCAQALFFAQALSVSFVFRVGMDNAWTRREPIPSGHCNPPLGQSWRDKVLNDPDGAAAMWCKAMEQRAARGFVPYTSDFEP